ncbi:AAA family ATPase [Clostridium sp. WILCCON 0269]|uniref:Nuclease SbcCD subunit C n=1 Tax=Candidatus Clostridium eludens TaxID=3381663 RepID=A0ABW8SPX9_9CLOT
MNSKIKPLLEDFLKEHQEFFKKVIWSDSKQVAILPKNSHGIFAQDIIELAQDIIGFAQLDSVNELYNSWRLLENDFAEYTEKRFSGNYNNLYLILLIPKSIYKNSLGIVSEIERDEFNFRKFVLPFEGSTFNNCISRLPFMELPVRETFRFLPETAEKLLKNIGVDTRLSNLLVKKRFEANDRNKIIQLLFEKVSYSKQNRCIEIQNQDKVSKIKPKGVKLKSLKIKGFRPYATYEEFNLDADLIVIAGPNGLGKTSFFDAIDFVVTGGIQRLENKKFVHNPLCNLNCEKDCFVELNFLAQEENGNNEHSIKRVFGCESKVFLDGNLKKDRIEILHRLTQTDSNEPVSRLVKMFRASHIISQSETELIDSLRKSSSLPKDILGRMLSLEDYVQAENRCIELLKEINTMVLKDRNKLGILKSELEIIEEDINVLKINEQSEEKIVDVTNNNQQVKIIIEKLLEEKIISDKYKEEINVSELREISASIENKVNEVEKTIIALQELQRLIINRDEIIKVINEQTELNSNLKEKLKEAKINLKLLKDDEQVKRVSLTRMQKESQVLHETINRLRGHIDNSSKLLLFEEKSYVSQTVIKNINSEIEKTQDILTRANEDIAKKQIEIENIDYQIKRDTNLIDEMSDIKRNLSKLQESFKIVECEELELKNISIKVNELKNSLLELKKQLIDDKSVQDELNNEIKSKQEVNNDFKNLLIGIRQHIKSSECPVCGKSHNSFDQLLKTVNERIGDTPYDIIQCNKKLDLISWKILKLNDSISITESKVNKYKFRKEIIKKNIETANRFIRSYKNKTMKINIDFDEVAASTSNDKINQKILSIKDLTETKKKLLIDIENLMKITNEAKVNLNKLKNQYSSEINSSDEIRKIINNLKSIIMENANFATLNNSTLDNKLIKLEKEISLKGLKYEKELDLLNNVLLETKNQIQVIEGYEKQIQQLNSSLMRNGTAIDKIKRSFNVLNISSNVEIEELQKHIDSYITQSKTLNELNKKVIFEETVLEVRHRSIHLNELQLEKKTKQQQISEIQKKIKDSRQALAILKVFKDNLLSQHNKALKGYCTAIQPLASTVLNRLRPVYGFGNLELDPKDTAVVDVFINHNHAAGNDDEKLPPFMYLSEAQMNIVGLSIFLSSTLTQTWSGLKTIMMDDPVQHFDDLNAYAFVDLIRGMLMYNNEDERPQIIISTCDNRLLRLMRRKFAPLEKVEKVKYYFFKSIGVNGPIIETN